MISVKCVGHIRTSVGASNLELEDTGMTTSELIETLRSMSDGKNPGFDPTNTLALIGDGQAFLAAASDRKIADGDRVVLIPFSHGG